MSYCPPCNAALPPKKSTAWDAVGCKNCCGTVFSTSKLDAIAALLRAAPQFPGVWLLLFHVTVTVSYRLCKLLASRLHLIQPDDSSQGSCILTNGYQYARSLSSTSMDGDRCHRRVALGSGICRHRHMRHVALGSGICRVGLRATSGLASMVTGCHWGRPPRA